MAFVCEKCVYSTNLKKHYNSHLLSKRHLDIQDETNAKKYAFNCEICNKGYKSNMGLFKHSKKCKNQNQQPQIHNQNSIQIQNSQNNIIEYINEKIETLMEKIEELSKKPTHIINTNNIINNITILNLLKNNYNNVISFEEFIRNINIGFYDIQEITDSYSCAKCLKDIIVKELKKYEINQRPFHCIMDEDENTETFIKNNEWIQEFMKDYDSKTPVLDTKVLIFIAKINQDIENLELPIDVKTKYIKVLRTMTNTENVEEIKTQLFYGIQINKYELNHNLLGQQL
jgi:hypothetical protein